MLTVTDEQYNAWWPGTHFRMHALNDKIGLGQLICMDEMIGDRHLQMKCIVTELERNKITWQFVRLARLPCWLTLLIQDNHSGATITHTIRAGYASLPGRLLDPLLRLYFSQKFARMMSEHFSFEFTQLPELIETLRNREICGLTKKFYRWTFASRANRQQKKYARLEDTIARFDTFLGVNMNHSRSSYDAITPMLDAMGLACLPVRQVVPWELTAHRREARLGVSRRWFCAVVLVSSVVALASSSPAGAAHTPTHKSVGSYDVNIGVVPAAQAQLSPSQMGSEAHRDAARRGDYHLVVSVRDVKSGQAVAGATVRAQVGPLGMSTQTKSLDAMAVNGEDSYGNYFSIPGRESYTVYLWIEGSGASSAHSEAVFTLRRD